MSKELFWLVCSVGVTSLYWVPYVLNRLVVRGLKGLLANPLPTDKPLSAWAQRAKQAHANEIENLAAFAPAVIVVHMLNRGDALTAGACALYFASRLIYFFVYTAGIPGLRTLAFTGGWIGIALLVARLFGAL